MRDEDKTKEQLINELARLRQRVAELETTQSERRPRDEMLRESEERFRFLSGSAPVGIYLTDAEGRCTYANARLLAMSGLTLEESLGYGWSQVIHPDDREAVLEEAAKAASQGREFSREFRLLTPQEEVRWVHVRTALMLLPEGEQVGRVGTVEDITERRQVEEALRESGARFRLLAETIQDVFWMSTPGIAEMIYVSPVFVLALDLSVDGRTTLPRAYWRNSN
jgi:PAS domain S-box-containing protein